MSRYARHVSKAMEPGMVTNEAGGLVHALDKWQRFERFLILGSEGGTFYVTEQKLTLENAQSALDCLKEDSKRFLKTVANVHTGGKAPKWQPAVFCLALASVHGDAWAKDFVRDTASTLLRTGSQLLEFISVADAMGKWRRNLRSTVSRWFTVRSPEELAYQAIKYQQRNGWSLKDALRLAHPKATHPKMLGVFGRILNKEINNAELPDVLLEEVKMRTVVNQYGVDKALGWATLLPREALPTELNTKVEYWRSAMPTMPATAFVRNLAQMTRVGLFNDPEAVEWVQGRLGNIESLQKARVHPISLLLAAITYAKGGHGGRSSNATYTPNAKIVDALYKAFEQSYLRFGPTIGGKHLVSVDVSGSMSSPVNGSTMQAKEAAAALAVTLAKASHTMDVTAFNTYCPAAIGSHWVGGKIKAGAESFPLSVDRTTDYQSALRQFNQMNGGTACSAPIEYALRERLLYDSITIVSDEATWADERHVTAAMRKYRETINPKAKLVVVGMVGTGTTLVDPNDPLALGVAGFNLDAFKVIEGFLS